MRVLVTGVKGQLGHDIVQICNKREIDVVGVDIDEMDITNNQQVETVIREGGYDVVVHCAAWTAVDAAEDNASACYRVNVEGTKNIAKVCNDLKIKMMYFSTDYVFAGEGESAWKEDDPKQPLSVYGKTKYEGELAVQKLEKYFILRISWVFGLNGNNFVKTMLKLGSERDTLSVVADQFGSPTYTYDLAKLCVDMIQTDKYGVYHVSNEGICTWYDFAKEIFRLSNIDVEVIPVASSEFKTKAARPKNSRLDKSKLEQSGFERLPSWEDALDRYIKCLDKLK